MAAALAVQLSNRCAPDPASISTAIGAGFESLMSFVTRQGLAVNGQPRTIYTEYGAAGVSFTLALPVAAGPPKPTDEPSIRVETLGAVKAYRFTHHGPYEKLALTYNQITEFMRAQGWMESEADWARYMPMWEEYLNDPCTTPAAELVTHIYLPLV